MLFLVFKFKNGLLTFLFTVINKVFYFKRIEQCTFYTLLRIKVIIIFIKEKGIKQCNVRSRGKILHTLQTVYYKIENRPFLIIQIIFFLSFKQEIRLSVFLHIKS